MPFDLKKSQEEEEQAKKQKPRNLDELRLNPFPIFPHEIYIEGPQVGCCKYCGLSKIAIVKLSLACTPTREKLREGGY